LAGLGPLNVTPRSENISKLNDKPPIMAKVADQMQLTGDTSDWSMQRMALSAFSQCGAMWLDSCTCSLSGTQCQVYIGGGAGEWRAYVIDATSERWATVNGKGLLLLTPRALDATADGFFYDMLANEIRCVRWRHYVTSRSQSAHRYSTTAPITGRYTFN
jgi:hypothetical protein